MGRPGAGAAMMPGFSPFGWPGMGPWGMMGAGGLPFGVFPFGKGGFPGL